MMCLQHFEPVNFDTFVGLHTDFFKAFGRKPVAVAVTVSKRTCCIVECLRIDILKIGGIVGAHPAKVIIVSDVGKRKTEARVASKIPALVAVNMTFIDLARTEEWKVRINQQESVAGLAPGWCND